MVTDYLFCEPLIIERLRDKVTHFIEVSGAAGLAQMTEEYPVCPSAYVIYRGDIINSDVGATGGSHGRAQFVTQVWDIVVCVYFADGRGLGSEISQAAGPLMKQVINALSGWSPDAKNCRPMTRSPQSMPAQYENGYGFYPITFMTRIPAALGGYS